MAPRASFAFLVLPAALSGCHYAGEATSACYVQPPDGTNQSALYRVSGGGTCGTGGTSITSFAVPEGTFAATIRFRVRGALPNRAYLMQRAAEVGNVPLVADGVCQRADGLPPWPPTDQRFFTFVDPSTGAGRTLTTDANGDGSLDFEHHSASIQTGTQFDVEMRLVDDATAPTSELRSGCMTVLAK